MNSSANSFGGTIPFNDTTAAVCGTLDDNNVQNGDHNDSQKPRKSQSGLLAGIATIQNDPLALSAFTQDCGVVHDSQDLSITVGEIVIDNIKEGGSDVADRSASEKDSESLEKGFEHLVHDQVAAAADVELDRRPASKAREVAPGGHDILATQPPRQHNSEIQLITQTARSSSFIECTGSMNRRGSQVDGDDDRRILHQQARKVSVVHPLCICLVWDTLT